MNDEYESVCEVNAKTSSWTGVNLRGPAGSSELLTLTGR